MENLKIKVNSSNAVEIIDLLAALGHEPLTTKKGLIDEIDRGNTYIVNNGNGIFTTKNHYEVKEITLQKLRDMVVLKRNCVDDATHTCGMSKVLKLDTKDYKIWDVEYSAWVDYTGSQTDFRRGLKPIQKNEVMKEYLEKQADGSYKIVMRGIVGKADDIEVPEWANYGYKNDKGVYFSMDWLDSPHPLLLWQRHTHPKELPFLDSLPEFEHDFGASSLNDQYVEIEQVRKQTIEATLAERQAQYGCFEDVARTTGKIMEALSEVRVNGLNDLPYPHRMALYMIASKMARIVNGDFNSIDEWHDISGYATLVERLIDG